MISLLHSSGNRKQSSHEFCGTIQGMEMLFSLISTRVHPSSFLAQHSQCFTTWSGTACPPRALAGKETQNLMH